MIMAIQYHAPTKQLVVASENFKIASISFIYAIRSIRDLANLPHGKYQRQGMMQPADHAQKGILDAAKALGIDLGAEWGEDLDVSE